MIEGKGGGGGGGLEGITKYRPSTCKAVSRKKLTEWQTFIHVVKATARGISASAGGGFYEVNKKKCLAAL